LSIQEVQNSHFDYMLDLYVPFFDARTKLGLPSPESMWSVLNRSKWCGLPCHTSSPSKSLILIPSPISVLPGIYPRDTDGTDRQNSQKSHGRSLHPEGGLIVSLRGERWLI
jgi:hypothetical protein